MTPNGDLQLFSYICDNISASNISQRYEDQQKPGGLLLLLQELRHECLV